MEVMAMIPRRNCLRDEETIESYSMGTLPEAEAAEFEEHLLVCEACQGRLTEQDAIVGRIRRAGARSRRESHSRERGLRRFPVLIPALTGLALLIVLGVAGLRWTRQDGATPPFTVKLVAMRGAGPGSQAPAGRRLQVQADLSGLPAAANRLELVDREGHTVWKGAAPMGVVPALPPGVYFMRAYSDSGRLLREYGLDVATEPASR